MSQDRIQLTLAATRKTFTMRAVDVVGVGRQTLERFVDAGSHRQGAPLPPKIMATRIAQARTPRNKFPGAFVLEAPAEIFAKLRAAGVDETTISRLTGAP